MRTTVANKSGIEFEFELFENGDNSYTVEITRNGSFVDSVGLITDNRKRVIDYDGIYALGKNLVKAIRQLGLTVPADML